MSRAFRATALIACGSLFALGACNEVLGIEPANVDPRLVALGTGNPAGMAGSSNGSGALAGAGAAPSSAGGNGGTGGSGHQHGTGGAGNAPAGDGGDDSTSGGTGGATTVGTGGTHDNPGPGSGGDDGHAGDDNSGPSHDPCEEYCDLMETECEGQAAQYRDRDQCLKLCSLFPPGNTHGEDDDAEDENTVACRLKYAKKTHYANGTEVTIYCRQAGPSGDGRCGTVCESFCSLMSSVCTDVTAPDSHFESDEACLSTCNDLPPANVPYSSSDPAVSDGDHALCRIFHAANAAMADTEEHCEHSMGITLCQAVPPEG